MTQGGPAFLTSDITRWECAPQKNTNKMYRGLAAGARRLADVLQSPSAAPRLPRAGSGTACPLLGRAKPQPLLPAQSQPRLLVPGDVGVRAPAPRSAAPREGGQQDGNALWSGATRGGSWLPLGLSLRQMPEAIFKGLWCSCSRGGCYFLPCFFPFCL